VGPLVVVTGGARGIGRATAVRLLAGGARVVVADIDGEAALAAASAMGRLGVVRGIHLDVTDHDGFAAAVEAIERADGPVELLVNNAGIMVLGAFIEQEARHDRRQFGVNVHGVVAGMRAVLPRMMSRGRGSILNVASVAGRVGVPHAAVYSATKFAVMGLTEAVRHEVKGSGVHVGVVCPSLVDTELIAGAGRPVWPPPLAPEDVAEAIVGAWKERLDEVYVPKGSAISRVLPVVLPARIAEAVARFLRVDRMFVETDHERREGYRRRSLGEGS
jgi:NAD(P)-dependent dehydrogenase (short-subunit alcohol dehydrogenase family)